MGFFKPKIIVVIIAIVAGGIFVVDYFGCTLKEGVPMGTLDLNDFLYGQSTPMFCDITNYLDAEAIGLPIDELIFGGTENVEGLDGFEIPFEDIIEENVIEDPEGEVGVMDPNDVIIPIQNETSGNDPIILPPEILPPEIEVPPEEMTPMLVDISFLSEVTKIATDGTTEVETAEFQFFLLEIFVEDTSNKDFSNGRFVTSLKLKSEPNIFIEGNGNYQVFLNNETLIMEPTPIRFSGFTDSNGELPVSFVSPTGLESQDFILSVQPLISQINPRGLTPLEFKITNVIATALDIEYSVPEGTLFSFNFFRDPNIILVLDSQSNEVRGFPTDDLLTIYATGGSQKFTRCYKRTRYSCWMTAPYYVAIGTSTISSVIVQNSDGQIILENLSPCTSANCINDFITRNDTYTVKHGTVIGKNTAGTTIGTLRAGSFEFTTPEDQMKFRFGCAITGTTTSQTLVCNFPK